MQTKFWARSIAADLLFAIGFYFGFVAGIENVQRVLVFYTWTIAIFGIIVGFTGDKDIFAGRERTAFAMHYQFVTEALIIGTFVWFGFIWLPIARLFADLCVEAARNREPKAREAA